MKLFLKYILKKLGLLNRIRKFRFKRQYRTLINRFKGESEYIVNFDGIESKFSLTDPFSAAFFASHFKNDIYEKDGLKALLAHVNENSIVFDVGSNIGYFTCFSGKYCSRGRVYAFELGRENVSILRRNLELNSLANVVVEHCAVSDLSGSVFVQDSAVGNAVLKIMNDKVKHEDYVAVRAITLDEYCDSNKVVPEFIKIDVEGAEMKVLTGMNKLIKGSVKLLIEIHEKELPQFNSSKEEVLSFLRENQFSIQIIGNEEKKNLLVLAVK